MANLGVNRVTLLGNLGSNPEVKALDNGTTITTLSLATGEAWTDKNSGERQERTEWHRLVLFGKVAEIARDYLKKGMKVYIEGKLRTRKWTDESAGVDRWSTEVLVDELQMLDKREEAA